MQLRSIEIVTNFHEANFRVSKSKYWHQQVLTASNKRSILIIITINKSRSELSVGKPGWLTLSLDS